MTMKDEWDNIGEFPFRVSLADWSYALVKPETDDAQRAWMDAYGAFIRDQEEYAGYQLLDIGCDAPLLYLYGEIMAKGDLVCYYDAASGSVTSEILSTGGLKFIDGKNLLCEGGGHMDVYYDNVYTVRDGRLVLLHAGEYGLQGSTWTSPDGYLYLWDGETVSEQEYMDRLEDAFDSGSAKYAMDDVISRNQMLNKLDP